MVISGGERVAQGRGKSVPTRSTFSRSKSSASDPHLHIHAHTRAQRSHSHGRRYSLDLRQDQRAHREKRHPKTGALAARVRIGPPGCAYHTERGAEEPEGCEERGEEEERCLEARLRLPEKTPALKSLFPRKRRQTNSRPRWTL